MPQNLIGKVVFVEKANADKDYYPGGPGEYVIVNQSPNALFGIKTQVGNHDTGSIWTLPLVGEKHYKIVSVGDDPDYVLRLIEELEDFAKAPERGEREWVESVYRKAASSVRLLRRVHDEYCKNRPMENAPSPPPVNYDPVLDLARLLTHSWAEKQSHNTEPEKYAKAFLTIYNGLKQGLRS